MTSPLTASAAASDPDEPEHRPIRARERTVPTIATPRTHHSAEAYNGAELGATCNRPGAYAAFSLPSMAFGERRTPERAVAQAVIDGRARQAAARAYVAREGSVPARVAAYLHEHGGHLTLAEIGERFGLAPTSVAATLKPAVAGGALVRHTIRSRYALSLPGYTPPADDAAELPG